MRNKIIMLSKKEYKENLIRMFDSLRDEHKGEENCIGVACGDCPLHKKACGSLFAFEAIEFAEKWTKEHPIKTNVEKFKEVFGIEPSKQTCVNDIDCENCEYYIPDDIECGVKAKFWNAEYTEPAESEIVKQGGVSDDIQIAIRKLLKDANEMAIEVDTGTYTMKAIGIGLLEQIAEQLKEGGAEE